VEGWRGSAPPRIRAAHARSRRPSPGRRIPRRSSWSPTSP